MSRLIMFVGLPASGKSTHVENYANQISNTAIHSSDKLRKELYKDVNNNENNQDLFVELHKRIKRDLSNGLNVIYDATNISHKRRKAFLDELKKINCHKTCYLMATPYDKCIDQNNSRDRKVPIHVIKKMYMNFYIPQYYEGWDKIDILWNFNKDDFETNELFNGENGLNKINQDNPNHTLTIGKHCIRCSGICEELKEDYHLNMAALYHDIGKRFTKEFKNGKGEDTDIAHYFQHHLVSAYDTMFYLKAWGCNDDDILKICNYIQWHMQLYFLKTDKSKNKFIKLVGEDFYNNLLILNEADRKSK